MKQNFIEQSHIENVQLTWNKQNQFKIRNIHTEIAVIVAHVIFNYVLYALWIKVLIARTQTLIAKPNIICYCNYNSHCFAEPRRIWILISTGSKDNRIWYNWVLFVLIHILYAYIFVLLKQNYMRNVQYEARIWYAKANSEPELIIDCFKFYAIV